MDGAGHASTDSVSSNPDALNGTLMSSIKFFAYPLVAILSIAASGLALADDPSVDTSVQTVSTLTRSQVQAEFVRAKAAGELRVWSTQYNPLAAMKGQRSRQDVMDELRLAQADHSAQLQIGEDSGSFALASQPAVRTVGRILASAR
jgi:hypothetical protein